MTRKSGQGFKERFRSRSDQRTNRRVDGIKARPGVDYGVERYGGQYGGRSTSQPPR